MLDADKMQVEEDNKEREVVAREPFADQLYSRSSMTKSPRQRHCVGEYESHRQLSSILPASQPRPFG